MKTKLKLKEIRLERHYSQEYVAIQTGLSRSYISEIEHGKYTPGIDVVCKLCKVLHCTPNDLIECIDE